MQSQKPVTLYQVTKHKVLHEAGYGHIRIRMMPDFKFTECGDAIYPLSQAVRDIDLPIHKFRRHDEHGVIGEILVAIHPDTMDVFDAIFDQERRDALSSLRAERQARADTLARIGDFNKLPLAKRIWRAIRKAV